jgi:superfamily II DNA/RNA helicase
VPWQPDDYVHRIGRTGRAGMTGIAITLATKEDAEAVAAIEKLTNTKIPRFGDGAQPAAVQKIAAVQPDAPSETASEPERKPRARRERAPRERRPDEAPKAAAPKVEAPRSEAAAAITEAPEPAASKVTARAPARQADTRRPPEPRRREEPVKPTQQPVAEDDDWNGPMPSFLNIKLT